MTAPDWPALVAAKYAAKRRQLLAEGSSDGTAHVLALDFIGRAIAAALEARCAAHGDDFFGTEEGWAAAAARAFEAAP